MLKEFRVENYKNFESEIKIDFSDVSGYQFSRECITEDMISKMIIYGRNAVGKTNFGKAVTDLMYTLDSSNKKNSETIKHAGTESDVSKFTYVFLFNDKKDEVTYSYEKKSNNKLTSEDLIINNTCIYKFNHVENEFISCNYDYYSEISASNYIELNKKNVDKTIPFLSWLAANASVETESPIYKIYSFANKMIMINNPYGSSPLFRDQDTISNLEKDIDGLNEFLNDMGVDCNLEILKLPEGTKELYFRFQNEYVKFADNASSGTASLFNFYVSFIMNNTECSLLYFDEFDAYFHYEMSEKVLKYLKKKFDNSLAILTTHNTNLMTNEFLRPDCLFILSSYGKLTPLNKATERELREGHNLEKMYIAGEFKDYE